MLKHTLVAAFSAKDGFVRGAQSVLHNVGSDGRALAREGPSRVVERAASRPVGPTKGALGAHTLVVGQPEASPGVPSATLKGSFTWSRGFKDTLAPPI